jgi:hypothetical protein
VFQVVLEHVDLLVAVAPGWDTGLLSTEDSEEAFTVRSGDVLEARVRLR